MEGCVVIGYSSILCRQVCYLSAHLNRILHLNICVPATFDSAGNFSNHYARLRNDVMTCFSFSLQATTNLPDTAPADKGKDIQPSAKRPYPGPQSLNTTALDTPQAPGSQPAAAPAAVNQTAVAAAGPLPMQWTAPQVGTVVTESEEERAATAAATAATASNQAPSMFPSFPFFLPNNGQANPLGMGDGTAESALSQLPPGTLEIATLLASTGVQPQLFSAEAILAALAAASLQASMESSETAAKPTPVVAAPAAAAVETTPPAANSPPAASTTDAGANASSKAVTATAASTQRRAQGLSVAASRVLMRAEKSVLKGKKVCFIHIY